MEIKCKICGRALKSIRSREAGYGPVCYQRTFGSCIPVKYGRNNTPSSNGAYYQIPGQMTAEYYLKTIGAT